ncbi:crossover junction endodeoxyribonuclease RuvC [bacterium]|nr:crossover junction endodeoxyribonuclease RuvC [bacterium]
MLIFGIDPGIGITGYSLIDFTSSPKGDLFELITSGSIQTDKNAPHPKRLLELKNDIDYLIKKYQPDCASIEQLFFFKNQKTIIPVAQARGVILLTLEENSIPMYEYTPLVVKQTITGHGRAEKNEVKMMVKNYINLSKNIKLDDTIDSIALALCHAQNSKFKEEIK